MKLLTTFIHERDFDVNYNSFFDYAPVDVEETLIFDEADAMFMLTHNDHFSINISHEQLEANGHNIEGDGLVSLNNYPAHLKPIIDEISSKIWDLPRIVYLERFGNPGAIRVHWDADGSLPNDLRDIDIPVASYESDLHPNWQYAPTIDNKLFYKTRETSKRKGTITMMCDNIRVIDCCDDVMRALIDCDSITRINILLSDDFMKEPYDNPKVNHLSRKDLVGMKSLLSDSEWTLNLDSQTGIERMGIEGGMCGAHPIYVDTDFYRKHFSDNLGVAYVDPDNVVDSLLGILDAGSDWNNHIDNFTKKLGCEYHIPNFWENVKTIIEETT